MNRKIALLGFFFLAPLPALAAPPEIADVIHADKPYGEGKIRFLFLNAYNAKLWTDAPTWSMDAPCAMEIQYGMGFDTGDLVKRTTEAYIVHHADFMAFLPFKNPKNIKLK